MTSEPINLASLTWTGDLVFTHEGKYKRVKEDGSLVAAWLQLSELQDKVGWYGFFMDELDPRSPYSTKPVYIGLSANLGRRLGQYESEQNRKGQKFRNLAGSKPGERFLAVKWCLADAAMSAAVQRFYATEKHLIQVLRPLFNESHAGPLDDWDET